MDPQDTVMNHRFEADGNRFKPVLPRSGFGPRRNDLEAEVLIVVREFAATPPSTGWCNRCQPRWLAAASVLGRPGHQDRIAGAFEQTGQAGAAGLAGCALHGESATLTRIVVAINRRVHIESYSWL